MLLEILRHGTVALAACALLGAAYCDIRTYQIPDGFALAIAGAFIAAALGGSLGEAVAALAIAAAVFAAGVAMFARKWLGGGDVKLLAATALWVSPALLAPFTVVVSFTGALLGIAMLTPLRRRMPPPPAALLGDAAAGALRQPMPFAVAIAAGGLFALLSRLAR
jgi:prepilin peptidase CpaA